MTYQPLGVNIVEDHDNQQEHEFMVFVSLSSGFSFGFSSGCIARARAI